MGNYVGGFNKKKSTNLIADGNYKTIENHEKDELLSTCPFDPRFPHTNQTKRCFVNFVDYHRCERLLGTYEDCQPFYKCYMSLCPMDWIDKWEEQMEDGTFPFNLPPKKPENENPENNADKLS